MLRQGCPHRVTSDVAEVLRHAAHGLEDGAGKPVIPDMTGDALHGVVAFGKYGEDPLHDPA